MNELITFLQQRNSAPRLTEPGPDETELESMFRAALRAPDHAWLRPSRFIVVAGERRRDLGEVLAQCLLQRDSSADHVALQKARNAPQRAPLLVVVVAQLQQHDKVPEIEQRLSAGCAAHSLLLAAEALGYAGIWRTGDAAYDRTVMSALGLAAHEHIIAFVYVGTREGPAKTVPRQDTADYVSSW